MAKNAVGYLVDYSGMAQFVAASKVMQKEYSNDEKIGDMIDRAYTIQLPKFHAEAATIAASVEGIKHVYEWGTVGINRGRSNMRPNPMSPSARLWVDIKTGSGGTRDIGFTFRKSVAQVPLPTIGSGFRDPKVLASMKRHVFHNKAAVMESGKKVRVKPTAEGPGFLIVPIRRGENIGPVTARDLRRGFVVRRNTGPTPGRKSKGMFTAFWKRYWETKGQLGMQRNIMKELDDDVRILFEQTSEKPKLRRVTRTTFDVLVNEETKNVASRYKGKRFGRR